MFKYIAMFVFAVSAYLLDGCPQNKIQELNQSLPLYKFYIDNNWVPLPEPDSRFNPGAVFVVDPNGGLSWQGTLADCGVPAELLAGVQGAAGKLTFSATNDYGAKAVLKIKGITAGPDWSKVKTADLSLDDHGVSSIDMLKLRLWLDNPDNKDKIPATCKKWLNMAGYYVARESYYVSKGSYTLKDNNGITIAVKGLQAGPVSIDPDAHVKVDQNGSITFDQMLYTAVRRLAYANGDWTNLGGPTGTSTVDQDLIGKLSYVKPKAK